MSFSDGQSVYPYFAARVPGFEAEFAVEDVAGVRTPFTFTFTTADDKTNRTWWAKSHTRSLTHKFKVAIAAAAATAGWPDTWSEEYGTATDGAFPTFTLKASATRFRIEADTFADAGIIRALGWTFTSGSLCTSSAVSGGYAFAGTNPPTYVWTPAGRMNDFGVVPTRVQVAFSPQSADGSAIAVQMQLGAGYSTTRPAWFRIRVNEGVGVLGARMQTYRALQTYWYEAAGYTNAIEAALGALDSSVGWWSRAVFGVPFIIGDMDSTSIIGEFEHADTEDNPADVSGFAALSGPNVEMVPDAGGGRRILDMTFRYRLGNA